MTTATDYCKAILKLMEYLPDQERMEIMRAYELTWHVVKLYSLKLARPTPAARPRLRDLHDAMERARLRLLGKRVSP